MKNLATEGIILRRIDYGEADRIITLLTRDFGKIRVMARGVRKQKSKMAGGIELFSVSEIHFIKGRGDIDTLMSTRLISHYGAIVANLSRTESAYNFLKVIDKTVEDFAGSEYYPVLHESLAALNDLTLSQQITEMSFMMRMLQNLGHVPQFGRDVNGKKLSGSEKFDFDMESVAFVSSSLGQYQKNHIKMLKLLAFNPPQALKSVVEAEEYSAALASLIRNMFRQFVPGAY
jgi:DNA repair protein RecO (recombination protein O)